MSATHITAAQRRLVAARANYLCEYCLIAETDTFLGCQVDHVISEKHGGPTEVENLAYACTFCNQAKGSDIASVDRETGKLVRFFDPRRDEWADHFRLIGSRIEAATPVGRVTARLLGFNAADRLLERNALIAAGRYPTPEARARMTVG